MKPYLGQPVVVHGIHANGSVEQAAVITNAWGDKDPADGLVRVNVTVFPDCGIPVCKGSVLFFNDRASAKAADLTHEPFFAFPVEATA
jgi:hypothetical protein